MADNQDFSGILGGPSAPSTGATAAIANDQDFSGILGTPTAPKRTQAALQSVTAEAFDNISDPAQRKNLQTYLTAIGSSEGADYNTIVGGSKFTDMSKHPGIVGLTTGDGPSTASGRYQITGTTYRDIAPKIGVSDFSEKSQDKLAVALLQRRGALDDVLNGRFNEATAKLGDEWQSLPSGTSKNQGKRTQAFFDNALAQAGGMQPVTEKAPASPAPAIATPQWQDLAAKPEFQKFTEAEKQLARVEYFNRYVRPTIKPSEAKASKEWFLAESVKHEPKPQTIVDRVTDAAGSVGDGIKKFMTSDTLPGSVMSGVEATSDKSRIEITGAPVTDELFNSTATKFVSAQGTDRERMLVAPGVAGNIARNLAKQQGAATPETRAAIDGTVRASDERIAAQAEAQNRKQFVAENPKLGALQSGFSRQLQGILDAVPLTADMVNVYAIDPFLTAAGMQPMGAAARLPGAAYFERIANEMTPDITRRTAAQAWGHDEFTSWAAAQFAQQTPQMLTLLAAAFVPALATPYLASMGVQTASTEYQVNKTEKNPKDLAVYDALTKGSIEILSEMLPLGVFHKVQNWVGKLPLPVQASFISNLTKRVAAAGTAITAQSLTEAIEEGAAQVGQNASERLILGKDTPLMKGVPDSMIIGGMMGGAFGSVNAGRALTRGTDAPVRNEADAARENALNKWNNNGLSPNSRAPNTNQSGTPSTGTQTRTEPTLDEFSAGLTPEQLAVDERARAALEPAGPTTLLADEIPASMILGNITEDSPVSDIATASDTALADGQILPDTHTRIQELISEGSNFEAQALLDTGIAWNEPAPAPTATPTAKRSLDEISEDEWSGIIGPIFGASHSTGHEDISIDDRKFLKKMVIGIIKSGVASGKTSSQILYQIEQLTKGGLKNASIISIDHLINSQQTETQAPTSTLAVPPVPSKPVPAAPIKTPDAELSAMFDEIVAEETAAANPPLPLALTEKEAKKKKATTAGIAMQNRLAKSNPLLSFLATHGVSIQDRADVGGQGGAGGGFMVPGHGPMFRKTGLRLDVLASLAHDAGLLTTAEFENPNDNGGVNTLTQMIQRVVNREVVPSAQQQEATSQDDLLMEAAAMAGIDTTGKTLDQVYDEVQAAYEAADTVQQDADVARGKEAELEANNESFELAKDRSLNDLMEYFANENESRSTPASTEVSTGTVQADAGQTSASDSGGSSEAFSLSGETASDAEARLAKQEQDAKDKKAADAKKDEADRQKRIKKEIQDRQQGSADNFQLGQSAEESLSGQQDMLSAPSAPAKPKTENPPATPISELSSMFDDIVAEETAPAAKPKTEAESKQRKRPAAATPRAATEAAASAAKNTAKGLGNAIDGLGALFGGNGTLGSGPVFNEETYAKAKPLFQEAVANLSQAGTDIKDVMRAVVKMVLDKFGVNAVNNMKPYVLRFAQDFESNNEGQNESTTGKPTEQNSQNDPAPTRIDQSTVPTESTGTGPSNRGTSAPVNSGESGPATGNAVPDTSANALREGRDNGLFEQGGELGLGRDAAESSNSERSSGDSNTGANASGATAEVIAGNDGSANVTFAEKVALQKAASKVIYKAGDRANIDASLPLLMPSQRQDVHFAETRLMKPNGYGVVFTNGTGTGKTYLGLGIVHRMIQSGKKNGLIIVPNDAVIAEWIPSAKNMGIDLNLLESTKDQGRGVSITTYANLANNLTLTDRSHDFVVADEAHNLMSNAQAANTAALTALRAISMHPDSAFARSEMIDRALYVDLADSIELVQKLTDAATNAGMATTPALTKETEKLKGLNGKVRESVKAQQAIIDSMQGENRPRAVFLSATPFAYEQTVQWANGYLFDYPNVKQTGAYNEPSPYGRFMIQHFGWRMRTGRLTEPDAKVDRGLMQRQFNTWMRKQGVLSSRILDVESDYDRKFILVDGGIGTQIDQALEWLRSTKNGLYRRFYDQADDQFNYLSRSRLLEAIKAKAAVPYIKEQHALGRKVVVFYDFNEGGGFSPFDFKGDPDSIIKTTLRDGVGVREASFRYGDFVTEFQALFPSLYGKAFADVMSPLDTLTAAFPTAGVYNGQSKYGKTRGQAIKNFNLDELPDSNLILVQSVANSGWSGHDTTGKNQRVLLNLGLPVAPTKAIQQEGRIYRIGQQSDAIFRYMNTGTVFERVAFATKVARRASTAENLAMGEQARGLLQVFIDAFQNSSVYTPEAGEGKGGKATDRAAMSDMTDFDRAKTFYFGQQKKTARTKAAEGADYFATPEPVGLKMVEWLNIQPGESVLEPSAGHGAIARWFPDSAKRTVVEPSLELASRLALLTDAKMINDSFESLNIINKFDGIAMNPPFNHPNGTGGKLAMEHIAKAFGHLNEGGRIVAIVPAGPAMDKRLAEWLNGTTTSKTGIVTKNNPDAVLVGAIGLPPSTFERAGTSVSTRILIIDKNTDGNNGTGSDGTLGASSIDAKGINELFDVIEDMPAPPRTAPVKAPPRASASASASISTNGKLVTDAPMVEYTTVAGKVLQGVYINDRAQAAEVDPRTFKPRGKSGYFVRMKYVVRPVADASGMKYSQGVGGSSTRGQLTTAAQKSFGNATAQIMQAGQIKIVADVDSIPNGPHPADTRAVTMPDGTVYVVAANVSIGDVQGVILHEVGVHVGMRAMLGESGFESTLQQLDQAIARGESWALAARDAVPENTDPANVREEQLGYLVERAPESSISKQVIAAVRTWFYRNFTMAQSRMTLTEADFRALAVSSLRAVAARATRTIKPKFGLLDTPMRLTWQKTGALALWRGAFRVLEKTANAALNNRVGEVIKAGLVDKYGLSDAVIERSEDMQIAMIKGTRTTQSFLDRMAGLTRAEYAILHAAANNADRAEVDQMVKDLQPDSQAALQEIKQLVRDLGQEAVDLGMLDNDIFKRNEWSYLHRSYLKYETDMVASDKASRATRITGNQFKQRGLADIVSSDRLMKWMPDFWGTRIKNGVINNDIIGQRFTRFERRDDPSPTPNLPGIDGIKPMGKLKEVIYWPEDQPTPTKFSDWVNDGTWDVRRVVGKDVVFRRDFSKPERERMGEIDDIRYAMAKTLNVAIHDVEVGKYFKWLAETEARTPGDMAIGDNVIDNPAKAGSKIQIFGKDTWVLVPDTKIRGTQVSAYGKLAGRYIPGPIWVDIRAVGAANFYSSDPGKLYEKVLRMWKISKTALSPGVHMNNVMGNIVMSDWHEVNGLHVTKSLQAWAGKNKNPEFKKLVQDFQDNGGEMGSYALSELQRDQLDPILKELLGQNRADNELNGIVNASQILALLQQGLILQAGAAFGQSKVGRGAAAIPKKILQAYQMEDQIFRLAAFIKARESGLTDRQAGRYARRSFLDYNITAPWIVFLKQTGILPFISFSYRAFPKMYETLRDKPWKAMKLGMVIGAANAASYAALGLGADDEDDERRWLPDEKGGKVWGIVPKLVRMPWNTKDDHPVFLDIRRFLPGGDVVDLGMSKSAIPMPSWLSLGGPLNLLAEFAVNRSSFTGKDITSMQADSATETTAKVLDYLYKFAMPNIPLPGLGSVTPGINAGQLESYAWTGIMRADQRQEGTFGRDQSVPMAIGSGFGIKLEGYDPMLMQYYAQLEMNGLLRLNGEKMNKLQREMGKGAISEREYERRLSSIEDSRSKIVDGFSKKATERTPSLLDLMGR